MAEATTERHIAEISKQVAERELGRRSVVDVDARRDVDADGDRIWRVVIVLRDPSTATGQQLSSFTRHLRQSLDPNEPFPIVSFRSVPDNSRLSSEAA